MTEPVVLLVEDNEDDEVLTLRAFRRNNLANPIVVARDGVEALDYLFGEGAYAGRDPSDLPHVVLLDLNLPLIDGLDVLARIRADARTTLVPVVVMTSSREEEDVARSYQLRANGYVRKPVDFAAFVEAVRQIGLYWLLLNEVPRRVSRP